MTTRPKESMSVLLILTTLGIVLALGSFSAHGDDHVLQPPTGLASTDHHTPMPEFSLAAVNGTTIRSVDLQGKVVVVRFWATW